MKKIFLIAILFILNISISFSQGNKIPYDSLLAQKLGADEYGMKMYVLAILKTGTNQIADKQVSDSLFKGHLNNITKLAEMGKLFIAGPLGKNDKQYRGIFILNTKSIDEAKELVQTDPAIAAKLLDVEFYNWYGSAALPVYLEYHNKIQKKSH